MRRPLTLTALALWTLAGCDPAPKGITSEPRPAAAPVDVWSVTVIDPKNPIPAWLTNGLIGLRIGRDGSGWDHAGWFGAGPGGPEPPAPGAPRRTLPFFVIDAYQTTGEEKIEALETPLALEILAQQERLSPEGATDYWQTLDFRTGVLTTNWVTPQIQVNVQTAVHPTDRFIATRWVVRPRTSEAFEVIYTTPPKSAASTPAGPPFHLVPGGPKARIRINVEGQSHAERADADRTWRWLLRATQDQPLQVDVVAAFGLGAASGAIARAQGKAPPRDEVPEPPNFEDVRQAAVDHWTKAWRTDIEIVGPREDQQAIRSWLFYLRAAVHPEAPMAVSPMGLSHTIYFGHVFWDADLSVFPALMLLDPARAATIPRYRMNLARAARENYAKWVAKGRPTGTSQVLHRDPPRPGALMYPWESSVTGHETVPGPSRFQHHITGTVVVGLEKAAMLGLADPADVRAIGRGAAEFYVDRGDRDGPGPTSIRGTMSPDEHFIGDNDLFTNLVAQRMVDRYLPAGPEKPVFRLPHDEQGRLLTYDGDPVRSYKQAAAVLAIYPLQYEEAERQAQDMMERFAHRVIETGPAMSDWVHALIWARIGERDRSYKAWRRGWQDFSKAPLLLFSEKRPRERTYFTTGAGGCLQTVLFGFLGARLDQAEPPPGRPRIRVHGGWLSFDPALPPAWESVHLRGLSVLGKNYDLMVTHERTQLTEGEP